VITVNALIDTGAEVTILGYAFCGADNDALS